VLSLYGQLAAGMTPGTFVAGEAASATPIPGQPQRAMYLPPNGAANAAFLETLRQLLVHESADGVVLAPATPRAWLTPGKRIAIANAPTRFGPVSFELEAHARHADVVVTPPRRSSPRTLTLKLRLPSGARIAGVTLDGRPYARVDRAAGTIDLSGRDDVTRLRVALVRKPARRSTADPPGPRNTRVTPSAASITRPCRSAFARRSRLAFEKASPKLRSPCAASMCSSP
jgi:hypothetical protein